MKFVKAIAILVVGPLLGIAVGFVIGVIAMPTDPNFVKNGSHGSPGDGFLIMGCVAVSFLISAFISIALALAAFRKGDKSNPEQLSS